MAPENSQKSQSHPRGGGGGTASASSFRVKDTYLTQMCTGSKWRRMCYWHDRHAHAAIIIPHHVNNLYGNLSRDILEEFLRKKGGGMYVI